MASNLCTDRWGITAGYNLCTDYWSILPVISPYVPVHARPGHGRFIIEYELPDDEALILAAYYLMRTRWEL
jgi:hypothetical protein